jgi:hypothetical protein
MGLRPRHPVSGDRPYEEFVSNDLGCRYFDIDRKDPGYIRARRCDEFGRSWLVLNKSTMPPSVKLDTTKEAKWKITDAEREGFYISIDDESGKRWWLTLGTSPLVWGSAGAKSVIEFRRAILATEKRHAFRFSQVEQSK